MTGAYDNAVAVFSRDASTGALTYVEREKDGEGGVDGLNGAYAVTVSPDGDHVYVAGAGDHAVAVFSRNPSTGALTFVEREKDGEAGVDGLYGARSVAVSTDGDLLLAASYWDDAVAAFRRDTSTGELTFLEVEQDENQGGSADGLDGALSVAVSPGGEHIYVAGHHDHAVAVLGWWFPVSLPLVLRNH